MAYIRGGELQAKRTVWRLSIITDAFWMVIFYVRAFWKTLFSLEESNAYGRRRSDRRPGYGGGGTGGGWGGNGGGGGGGGGGAPPPGNPGNGAPRKRFSDMTSVRGTDHQASCGTCCAT